MHQTQTVFFLIIFGIVRQQYIAIARSIIQMHPIVPSPLVDLAWRKYGMTCLFKERDIDIVVRIVVEIDA